MSNVVNFEMDEKIEAFQALKEHLDEFQRYATALVHRLEQARDAAEMFDEATVGVEMIIDTLDSEHGVQVPEVRENFDKILTAWREQRTEALRRLNQFYGIKMVNDD